MATIIGLTSGEQIEFDLSLSEVSAALEQAIAEDVILKVRSPDGEMLALNPRHIEHVRESPEREATARQNGEAAPHGAPQPAPSLP